MVFGCHLFVDALQYLHFVHLAFVYLESESVCGLECHLLVDALKYLHFVHLAFVHLDFFLGGYEYVHLCEEHKVSKRCGKCH